MIKFNKYNVTNTETKEKARAHYAEFKRLSDNRQCVTIYAKDWNNDLENLFESEYKDDSDIMIDYFEKGKVVLFEDHALYAAAYTRAVA